MKKLLLLIGVVLYFISSKSFAKADFLNSAQRLFQSQQYSQVVTLLSDHADQMSEEGYLVLAAAYGELKQYESEQRILNQLAIKNPKDYQWPMLIAQSHQKKAKDLKEADAKKKEETLAVTFYRTALKLNPKFKPALDSLLQIFKDRKENHEARELLMGGISSFGPRPEWLNELCQLQALDGFLDPAIKTCDLAIRSSPSFPDNYVYLSQALMDQNQDQKAQKIARYAGNKFLNSEFTQWASGKVYLISKNYEAARKYFERAVKIDPNSKRSLEGLAESLYQSGNPEDAFPRFESACKRGLKKSEELHVKAAELRMKSKDMLGSKYRGLAENCL